MYTYISLNKNLDCQYLCKQVFEMLNKCVNNNVDLSNKILCIEIKEPKDSQDTLVCLEYKDISV
jgi:hypothetical protein